MKKFAVIVAGGSGLRMGADLPKQFMLLNGKPVLWYTLTTFISVYNDLQIILVLPEQYIETGNSIIKTIADSKRIAIVAGGDTRFQSVKNGLKLVDKDAVVFVHDGVRCMVTTDLIKRCYEATLQKGNAIPAILATDSIRIENEKGNASVDRNKVRLIQTPQTFLATVLLPAFEQPYNISFTDEASVAEQSGCVINLIEGEKTNIKITHPVDVLIAEHYLQQIAKV